jgi:hypothetical protein
VCPGPRESRDAPTGSLRRGPLPEVVDDEHAALSGRDRGIHDGERLRGRKHAGKIDDGIRRRGAQDAVDAHDLPRVGAGVHAHVAEPSGRRAVRIEHVDIARLAEQRQAEQHRGGLQAQHGIRVDEREACTRSAYRCHGASRAAAAASTYMPRRTRAKPGPPPPAAARGPRRR